MPKCKKATFWVIFKHCACNGQIHPWMDWTLQELPFVSHNCWQSLGNLLERLHWATFDSLWTRIETMVVYNPVENTKVETFWNMKNDQNKIESFKNISRGPNFFLLFILLKKLEVLKKGTILEIWTILKKVDNFK